MPRKSDASKMTEDGKYYKSRLETSKTFNKDNYDQIIVRVPKGAKELITNYVEQMSEKYPEDPKYQDIARHKPSVNALILALLETETGLDLKKKN